MSMTNEDISAVGDEYHVKAEMRGGTLVTRVLLWIGGAKKYAEFAGAIEIDRDGLSPVIIARECQKLWIVIGESFAGKTAKVGETTCADV